MNVRHILMKVIAILFTGLILLSLHQIAVSGLALWWLALFLAAAVVLAAVNSIPGEHALKFVDNWC